MSANSTCCLQMLKKENGGYKTRHDWKWIEGFFVTSLTGLISTWSEVQVSMWSQEYYYYCVSNSCINYFKKLLPLKKKKTSSSVCIHNRHLDWAYVCCIVWKICNTNWHKNSLFWWCTFMYFLLLLESRNNFRFSAWWIFIFSWRISFTISLQIGCRCAVMYCYASEKG